MNYIDLLLNRNELCACVGPSFGEHLCPCRMEGLPRSEEYVEYMLPENVEKRKAELMAVLKEM